MTHTGKIAGIDPTGRRVTIAGMALERIEDVKIVEGWRNIDVLSLYQQIGALG
jgi:predicted ester cyclase